MPAPSPSNTQQAVILAKLDQIQCDMADMKATNTKIQEFILQSSVDRTSLRARVEEHDAEIKEIKEVIEVIPTLSSRVGYMVAIGGIVGGAIVLWLINSILHSAFPILP